MNPIIQVLQANNIAQAQINDIFTELTTNPLMAMNTIASLGIPQEQLQPVMMQVMTNPGLIKEAVQELGLDVEAMEKAKQAFQQEKE
ncbi:DUF2999 family protein [Thalassotalea euphylliae]|uniref:DUF2999 family protein n=1 Tax=Thalassotalea euphylliae TaxID=1655234 RepID=A0A3E0TS68_9GAMM|nr:DUF2999 family protein [Thalassotalea euphylliae]REL27323.1 DUF2999 family protein [Thalassotalea euphylliae]